MNEFVPEGWSVNKLSDICNIVGGGTPERAKPEYWGGDIPWVSPTEVTSLKSRYITKTKEKITDLGLNKSSAKLHPKGTVLMTSRASIGYVAINTIPVTTNQGFQSLQCRESINNEYLYQHISWIKPELEKLSAGSTFSEISSTTLKGIQLTYPPLPEQQKIAAILTSVDEVIEKTQTQINKLKDLKTGMMQELLTRGVGVDGKAHTEFKDSPVGRIPMAWDVELIGNLFSVQLGKMLSKASKITDSPLSYLGNKNIQWGRVVIDDLEKMDFSEKEKQKFSLETGDLLMCEGGDVGRCAIWMNEISDCYYQKAIHRLRPIENRYKPVLLMEYMKFAKENGLLVDYISQTSIAHLTKEKLISIPVPVPSITEQEVIIRVLETLSNRLKVADGKLKKNRNLKKALMQDLLTGKVRVKVDS
ncbi:hypothetical protein ERW49_07705 [Aliivibrio finisterrensis]|uniref:Type I restriction modification DNA specificity domain-containing protein n=1 Tax=Aliivibrio finisterrensis TaxID=511998 RepID=A0A4Q5KNI2_9GAMM|nr:MULTISPECIES: restriction endonuclease subunit S [Aliivibrio]MDD9173705.1 restriction endonuclease subunit S [Aliivibrio sp. S3TY1]MDD9190781.1 restriction endonuclease subunit S [Aliivibrio sp. S2TY2]RYU47008.1 hypothetical protein ERW49_07705 [Aliivibrio finisterrensis]